ncbi:MAG: hypothetical protein QOD24_1658, partial [Solirubrobacteraceae bacterium]|nr:hypothetical protein [Solirubrobacteraceae bacterium]
GGQDLTGQAIVLWRADPMVSGALARAPLPDTPTLVR